MSSDWFSVSMAFSTGMTCMPMPAPPGGTMAVICSSGKKVIRSKNAVTSGCSAICCLFMLKNSALPGTNIGSTYCFSRRGFSQLYSSKPTQDILYKSGSSSSAVLPVAFTISGRVIGLRTFIFKATSAISSVTMLARPQYSGSSAVRGRFLAGMRSVIICPSFTIFSRSTASFGISKGSLLSSSGNAVGLLIPCSFIRSPFICSVYACHWLTCSFSQAVHSSMPSPVRAQMGMTFACGLRIATYSRHLSMSKSKYGSTSILLTSTTSHT